MAWTRSGEARALREERGPVGPALVPRPLLVEFVGPAGAGKSTLAAELNRRDPELAWVQRARTVRDLLPVALDAAAFLPYMLGGILSSPRFAWRSARYHVRLESMRRVARLELGQARTALVLEHGPIYTLARIAWLAQPAEAPAPLRRYAARSLARWARMLDLVVFLDAPDAVLAGRIRTRAKEHPMRASAAHEIRDFLERYGDAYRRVLADLERAGGPGILSLRTDELAVPAMADRVVAALAGARRAS